MWWDSKIELFPVLVNVVATKARLFVPYVTYVSSRLTALTAILFVKENKQQAPPQLISSKRTPFEHTFWLA